MLAPTLTVGATLPGSDPGCVDRRGGEPAMGISASAQSVSAGARRVDRRDRVERDHCRFRASASERVSRDARSWPES